MLQARTRQCQNDIYFFACFVMHSPWRYFRSRGTWLLFSCRYVGNLREHISVSPTLIVAPALSCSPQLDAENRVTNCLFAKNIYPPSAPDGLYPLPVQDPNLTFMEKLWHFCQVQSTTICHFRNTAKNILIRFRPQKATKTILI